MCALCDEYDEHVARLAAVEGGEPLSAEEAARLRRFLEEQRDAHVDAAGEASWEG